MQDDELIININKFNKEIIEILTSDKPSHFEKYLFIKREFNKNNLDSKFKEAFCLFYRLNPRLNQLQKEEYFSLLSKKESTLENILPILYKVLPSKLHLSFASKLKHTLDNDLPIYDRNVAEILGLPKQAGNIHEKKLENRLHIYAELKERFHTLLLNKQIAAMLKKNRKPLALRVLDWQDDLVSDTKLLDSILWALHTVIIKNKLI